MLVFPDIDVMVGKLLLMIWESVNLERHVTVSFNLKCSGNNVHVL